MGEEEVCKIVKIAFNKTMSKMVKHLRPLYVRAQINGKTLERVSLDGGTTLNIMPLITLEKFNKE